MTVGGQDVLLMPSRSRSRSVALLPRVVPHEDVNESVTVRGPRHIWTDLARELADLAALGDLVDDPERAAVSGWICGTLTPRRISHSVTRHSSNRLATGGALIITYAILGSSLQQRH